MNNEEEEKVYNGGSLPGILITAPLTWEARNNIKARRGRLYLHEGRLEAFPFVATTLGIPMAATMAPLLAEGTYQAVPLISKLLNVFNPSSFLGKGAYNTVLGGTGKSLAGATADAALASSITAEGLNKFKEDPSLKTGVEAAVSSVPIVERPINKIWNVSNPYLKVFSGILLNGANFKGKHKIKKTINALTSVGKSSDYVKSLYEHPDLLKLIRLCDFPKLNENDINRFGSIWDREASKGSFYPLSEGIKYLNPESSEKEIEEGFNMARNTLNIMDISKRYADRINYSFNKMYNELSTDPTFKSIIDESPLYIDSIYRFYKNGDMSKKEEFVKKLINRANSYRRFMREPHTEKEFLTFNGSGLGGNKAGEALINVEGFRRSDFAHEYGSYPAFYQGLPTLKGPIETWWSLRIPKGVTVNAGMHSRTPFFDKINKKFLNNSKYDDALDINGYLNSQLSKLPPKFVFPPVHQIFTGTRGTELPNFKVTINDMPDHFTWGLGYKHGGKL